MAKAVKQAVGTAGEVKIGNCARDEEIAVRSKDPSQDYREKEAAIEYCNGLLRPPIDPAPCPVRSDATLGFCSRRRLLLR